MAGEQTSVNPLGQPAGFPGLECDSARVRDNVTGVSEETVNDIPWGAAVIQGTADQGMKLPSGSGDVLKGVCMFGFRHAPGTFGDVGATGLAPGEEAPVKRIGRIAVLIDQTLSSISPNIDRGFFRYSANGGNTVVGAFTNANDAGHTTDCTKQVVFSSGIKIAADGTKYAEINIDVTAKP